MQYPTTSLHQWVLVDTESVYELTQLVKQLTVSKDKELVYLSAVLLNWASLIAQMNLTTRCKQICNTSLPQKQLCQVAAVLKPLTSPQDIKKKKANFIKILYHTYNILCSNAASSLLRKDFICWCSCFITGSLFPKDIENTRRKYQP